MFSGGQQIVTPFHMANIMHKAMFWPHLDHRVEQSRIISDMVSSNYDLGIEFTSFCIDTQLRWVSAHHERVRPVESQLYRTASSKT